MNNLNEIMVSFENEKKQEENQQEQSEENNCKEKINDESQLNYFLFYFYENLSKRYYKKTIKEIDSLIKNQDIDWYGKAWKFHILKIRAQLKIIKKKIEKYLIVHFEKAKSKYKINSIKKYFKHVLENLNLFIEKYSASKDNEDIIKVDNLLHCYFEYIYLYCLFNKKLGKTKEIISYLSLLIRLYNETKLIFKSERTLSHLERCLILFCQILISNHDYLSAINYINIITKICLEHLVYNVEDLSEGVFIDDKNRPVIIKKKKDNIILSLKEQEIEMEKSYGDKNIKKIIVNLIILFYYRGICYENMGKINYSIKSYYQIIWLNNKFFYHSLQKSSLLFQNTLEKSIELKYILDYVMRRIRFYDRISFFLKRQLEKKEKKENEKDIMYKNLFNSDKLIKLENKLLNLNINEVDTINRFDIKKNIKEPNGRKREGVYKNIFMSDTRLLNSYLREDFRHIIDNMNKIKILDIDITTREKMQKLLRGIYFDQSLRKFKAKNKTINIKTNYTTNVTKNINITSKIIKDNKRGYNTICNAKYQFNKKDIIPTDITKKKVISSENTFRIMQTNATNNYSKKYISPDISRTNRPKSSLVGNRQKSLETRKINTRIFMPISSAKNHIDYKTKTIITPIEKQKHKNISSSIMKSNYNKIRTESMRLFKKIPTENKDLNKFFNKKYLTKRNYIKFLEERDLKFQKCILKIKKEQKPKNENLTKEKMKKKAEELFKRVMGIYLTNPSNWKNGRTKSTDKNTKLYEKLQNTLISSLDNVSIIKYNIEKNKERNKIRPMTEQMNSSNEYINLINNNIISEINNKIEEIKQREMIEIKNYKKLLNNNNYMRTGWENDKNFWNDKMRSASISPSIRKTKSVFKYENNKNMEHIFYNSNKK